jgi:hypothetical protein
MPIPTTAPAQRHHELLCGTQATALGDQAAVPGQQRSRRDEPVGAQHSWQLPGQRRQDGTVGPVRPGPGHLTAEPYDLMTEHHDLGILGRLAAAQQHQPAEDPDHDEVEQAKGHEPRSCRKWLIQANSQVTTPAASYGAVQVREHQIPDPRPQIELHRLVRRCLPGHRHQDPGQRHPGTPDETSGCILHLFGSMRGVVLVSWWRRYRWDLTFLGVHWSSAGAVWRSGRRSLSLRPCARVGGLGPGGG